MADGLPAGAPADGVLNEPGEFKFPANIKQMGNVDKDLKIYVEDYVYTYLYQFARSGGGEKLAVLIGKNMEVEGAKVIMINGAIEGVATEYNDDDLCFTEDSWNYIINQKEKYFKGLTVVGWVHVQPDFGTNLIARDLAFHRQCFEEIWQTLFVIDPIERADAFYCYEGDNISLRQARGYFIYYEKNEDMQTYIIENSSIKPKETVEEEAEDGTPSKTAMQRLLGITGRDRKESGIKAKVEIDRVDAAGRIREVLKQKAEEKERIAKGRYRAFAAVCGALCVACFMLCAGLLTNIDRIQRLEEELLTVKSSYDTMNELVANATAQVFAVQQAEEEKKQTEPVKEEEQKEQKPEAAAEPEGVYDTYYVEDGDSLWYISRLFYGGDEGIENIMQANGLSDENLIYSGQRLIIPKK